jgi:hypothetical protein
LTQRNTSEPLEILAAQRYRSDTLFNFGVFNANPKPTAMITVGRSMDRHPLVAAFRLVLSSDRNCLQSHIYKSKPSAKYGFSAA